MSRRSPAPGSRTSQTLNRGLGGGQAKRNVARIELAKSRVDELVASLPRIVFDEQGTGHFKPDTDEQAEALQLAAERFDWELHDDGEVVCRIKLFHYNKRQHDKDCAELVPKLYFQRTPSGMMAICNNEERSEDLRHGLDILAERYGWTVNHDNLAVSYVHKPYHAKPMAKAA